MAKRITYGSQPSIKGALASQDTVRRADMAIARSLINYGIPFSIVQSPYFQLAIAEIIVVGSWSEIPSYHNFEG